MVVALLYTVAVTLGWMVLFVGSLWLGRDENKKAANPGPHEKKVQDWRRCLRGMKL